MSVIMSWFFCRAGWSCASPEDQGVIGGSSRVKAENFGGCLAGFSTQSIGQVRQPHAVFRRDAKGPNAMASAGGDTGWGGFLKVASLDSEKESRLVRS